MGDFALFLALMVCSLVVVGLLVVFEQRLAEMRWYRKASDWLGRLEDRSVLVIRIATGAVLLLSWQANALLMPDLAVEASWIGWYQFALTFLLLSRRTVPWAGGGLLLLYGIGLLQFGLFHMLDHALFVGVGYYLAVSKAARVRVKASGLPALYLTVGFTLCWLALEKFVYPQWGLYVLDQNPQLALGFDHEFFLMGTAFVEFCLGFLLMIGLLPRPVAALIPAVFFLTTLVFGKIEVLGHAMIYAVLIVFLLQGRGHRSQTPATVYAPIGRRVAFASTVFSVLLAALIVLYANGALRQYEGHLVQSAHSHELLDVAAEERIPSLDMVVHEDPVSGWNIELATEHFRFTPDACGGQPVEGQGHAHLYINGQKAARIYGACHHVPALEAGAYELQVTLNTNDHRTFALDDKPIAATYTLVVD